MSYVWERVAIGVLLGVGLLLQFKTCNLSRDLEAADAAANLLRTEELLEDATAAGWETELVGRTEDLTRQLQDATGRTVLLEKEKTELARSAELLDAKLAVMADMYADVVGQIHAQDAVVYASDASAAVPDSVVAQLTDSLLTATVRYRPPSDLSIPEYRIRLALALGIIDTPDGRALITAKAENPKVELSFGEIYYDPPDPVAYCSIGQKATWAGYGAFAVQALEQLFGVVR